MTINALYLVQQSIFTMLMSDKRTDIFFKVFYDRMKDAQQEIKNTVTVNTTNTQRKPDKEKEDKRRRKDSIGQLVFIEENSSREMYSSI